MHLKSLEAVGFKSFAERTRLDFEQGMTAIVGPNGCGKSNISDAIRWVLGEQSAKALRGGSMQDVIFNGTDSHKPLNMAEVSFTLTNCEDVLNLDYNEVTVTRRVFRSGEGQYFINKRPCRLKDIQRMFMDTGIGTNSYSILEQGKIDQILSSRPDDRRTVFEEASGITKYKADKKEALRKLDHTEANLLRLEDIIREVKRQIGSLQRQAGKARRYKKIQDELRSYDIYASRNRINAIEKHIHELDTGIASIAEQHDAVKEDVQRIEQEAHTAREALTHTEQEISDAMEAAVLSKTDWESTRQLIKVNQDRIAEIERFADRDSRDAEEARNRLEHHRTALHELTGQREEAETAHREAQTSLGTSQENLREIEDRLEQTRNRITACRNQAMECENKAAQLQNELSEAEAQDRATSIRKERLTAERTEINHSLQVSTEKLGTLASHRQELDRDVQRRETALQELQENRKRHGAQLGELKQTIHTLQQQAAGKQARLDLLEDRSAEAEEFPGGARFLMTGNAEAGLDTGWILGTLADLIRVQPEYQTAFESCMRTWADAVVLRDNLGMRQALRLLADRKPGAARMLSASVGNINYFDHGQVPGTALIDCVRCDDSVRLLAERLLSNIRVIDSLDQLPEEQHPQLSYVTRDGTLVRGDGSSEYWKDEAQAVSPIALQHQAKQAREELVELHKQISLRRESLTHMEQDEEAGDQAIQEARCALEEARRLLSESNGEHQAMNRETIQLKERVETVSFELQSILDQTSGHEDHKSDIAGEIESLRERQVNARGTLNKETESLHALEEQRSLCINDHTEKRVAAAELSQRIEHLNRQQDPLKERVEEIEHMIQERSEGLSTYKKRIEELQQELETARGRVAPLEAAMQDQQNRLNQARSQRQDKINAVEGYEKILSEKRTIQEQLRSRTSQMDVTLAEEKIRLQNVLERVTDAYQVSREQIDEEADPEWPEEQVPDLEQVEIHVAEMRAKLDAMGPVNLVAIEEYQELEERYQFLIQQQEDLVNAKQQLLDMIQKINETTTEMFTDTFNQVNEHFQTMFKKLFGGGTATLVLVDEEDVLESGIDIIARPPGKKLQTVTLLSGGERTMTAVALLFALYEVKPSPFCVLDELDAPLDDANIGRFVSVVKEFVQHSQFIVITHNRITIGAADLLYGVTMEKKGVSKIVSVKLSEFQDPKDPAPVKQKKPKEAEIAESPTPKAVETEPVG